MAKRVASKTSTGKGKRALGGARKPKKAATRKAKPAAKKGTRSNRIANASGGGLAARG